MRWVTLAAGLAVLAAAALALFLAGDPLMAWASTQQKALQQDLALALSEIRRGDPTAIATLIGACALYGVVHAVGPGHGKLLVGGAAIASQRTARRMAGLGLIASLAQGVMAVIVVYGGLGLLSLASRSVIQFSETWLTAASYGAIALVGLWLAWRGGRLAWRLSEPLRAASAASASPALASAGAAFAASGSSHGHSHSHSHAAGHACDAGCKHLPTAEEVDRVDTWRDAVALILSIGMRPCSGALIVLALAWRYELYGVGVAAALAMALGTGAFVAGVAVLAVSLRDIGPTRAPGALGQWSMAATMVAVGMVITAMSLSLAANALDRGPATHPFARSAASTNL